MQKTKNRLFWDSSSSSFSLASRVKRVFEYGSFTEVVNYPFEEVQQALNNMQIDGLRTSESRKQLLIFLKPYLLTSESWDAALSSYIKDCLYSSKKVFKDLQ